MYHGTIVPNFPWMYKYICINSACMVSLVYADYREKEGALSQMFTVPICTM